MEEKKKIFDQVFIELGIAVIKMASIIGIAKVGISYLDNLKEG